MEMFSGSLKKIHGCLAVEKPGLKLSYSVPHRPQNRNQRRKEKVAVEPMMAVGMGVHFQVQESSERPGLSGAFAFRPPMSRATGKDAFNFFSVTTTGLLSYSESTSSSLFC